MLIALICLGFAGTVFALASVLLGNRSDVSRRVAELEDTATVHTHHRTTPIVQHLLSGVDKTAIAAKLAEAGWYKTTVAHFVLSRVVCFAVMAGLGAFFLIATQQLTLGFIALVVLAAVFGLTIRFAASQNRDSDLYIGRGFADRVRLLRELDLHHGYPRGISRDPV